MRPFPVVGPHKSHGVLERPLAPDGKDAGPKESFQDFEDRGRRQAVISGRREDVMARVRAH